MWEGGNDYRVQTASVTADAYITSAINLIKVTGIDLNFPGWTSRDNPIRPPITPGRTSMPADDVASRGDAIPGGAAQTSPGVRSAPAPLAPVIGTFTLSLCHAAAATSPSLTAAVRHSTLSLACASRRVTGAVPPLIPQATATLSRANRNHASGTDTHGRIQLTAHGGLSPSRYTLTLRELERYARHGNRRRLAVTYLSTIVPIVLR